MSDAILYDDSETTAPRPDFTVKVISPETPNTSDGEAIEGSRANLWAVAEELAKQRVAAGNDPGRVTTQFNPAGDTTFKDAKGAARDLTYSRKLSAGEAASYATGDYDEAVRARAGD